MGIVPLLAVIAGSGLGDDRRLQSGDRWAGVAYIVEASTNLVDWEAVGVATVNEDGSFEFEDADAAKHQCRFYRVVNPTSAP